MKTKDKKSQYGDDKEPTQMDDFFSKKTEDLFKFNALKISRNLTPKK